MSDPLLTAAANLEAVQRENAALRTQLAEAQRKHDLLLVKTSAVVSAAREHYSVMAVMLEEGPETRTQDDYFRAICAAKDLHKALSELDGK